MWGDGAVLDYDAKAQPAVATGNQLIVSYDQNSLHFYSVYDNSQIYKPSYLELGITFKGSGGGQ